MTNILEHRITVRIKFGGKLIRANEYGLDLRFHAFDDQACECSASKKLSSFIYASHSSGFSACQENSADFVFCFVTHSQ